MCLYNERPPAERERNGIGYKVFKSDGKHLFSLISDDETIRPRGKWLTAACDSDSVSKSKSSRLSNWGWYIFKSKTGARHYRLSDEHVYQVQYRVAIAVGEAAERPALRCEQIKILEEVHWPRKKRK